MMLNDMHSVPSRRSPTGHRILNLLFLSTPRRVSLTRQQVTSLKIREKRFESLISLHVWFVPPSFFSCLSSFTSCICHFAPIVVYSCLDTFRFCCLSSRNRVPVTFPAVKVVFDWSAAESFANGDGWPGKSTSLGQSVETPQVWIGNEPLHTTVGILAAGLRRNLVEDNISWNRAALQTNTERGSVARDVPFAYTTSPGTRPR